MYKQLKMFNHKFDVFSRTLPQPIRPASKQILGWSKTAMSLLLSRNLSLYKLPIDGDIGKGCVGYLGPGTNLNFIAHQAGTALDNLQPEWQMPWWQIRKAISKAREEHDIIVIELPQRYLGKLNLANGIFTLPYLRWRVKTNCDWKDVEQGFLSDARRDLRKSENIKCFTTDKEMDLSFFYNEIYRPYITQNFGEMARLTSYEELKYYFQRGWLVLAKNSEDDIVGGSMCFIIDNVMYDYVGATVVGLDRLTQRGVTANYFVHMIRLAHEKGCTDLDLGLARPLLNDGVARYKRKWGAYTLADFNQNWGFWINVGRDAAKASSFLAKNPWIWLDNGNRLRGLLVRNDATEPLNRVQIRKICKKYWASGLDSLIVCAELGFKEDVSLTQNPMPILGPATVWSPHNSSKTRGFPK